MLRGMSNQNSRFVSPDGNDWVVQKPGASRVSSRHGTQGEAIDAARSYLHNGGGGELNVQGRNGQIRQKDSVPPGHDPFPPPG